MTYYYNGEILKEIKTQFKIFSKQNEKENAAYIYIEYYYNIEKYAVNICYFKIENDSTNELEISDEHIAFINEKQIKCFLKKFGWNENNRIDENVDVINKFLYDYVFINNIEFKENIYKKYTEMKKIYSESLDFLMHNTEVVNRKKNLIKELYNKLLLNKDNIKYYLRVFNVGQANCSALYASDNITYPVAIFDIGYGKKSDNKSLINMLNDLKEVGCIIVSHFDYDHFNLYKKLNDEAYERLFIVHEFPTTMKKHVSAFVNELYKHKSSVYIIKNDSINNVSEYIDFDFFKITQGLKSKKNKNQSTLENTHSLVSIIEINNSTIILPGDALEDEFEANKIRYRYGYISHHGCKMESIVPYEVDEAFLPVDDKYQARYKHPQQSHILKYINVIRFGDDESKMYDDNKLIKDNITIKCNKEYFDWKL